MITIAINPFLAFPPVASYPSIVVSGAGTAAADGTYSYRGTYNNKPYYNLLGQPDDATSFAIAWNGDIRWEIVDEASADRLYVAEQDVATPDLATFTSFDGAAPAPTVTHL